MLVNQLETNTLYLNLLHIGYASAGALSESQSAGFPNQRETIKSETNELCTQLLYNGSSLSELIKHLVAANLQQKLESSSAVKFGAFCCEYI